MTPESRAKYVSVAEERLLTRDEVAAWLKIPAKTLDEWAYRGVGPRYMRLGRHARYRLADIKSWMESQEVTR